MVMQKRQILVIFLIILYITLITKLERLLVHCAALLTPILSFTLLFNHQITSETSSHFQLQEVESGMKPIAYVYNSGLYNKLRVKYRK